MNRWRKSVALLLAWVMLFITPASASTEAAPWTTSTVSRKLASGVFAQISCTSIRAVGQLSANTCRGWQDGTQKIASDLGDTYDYDAFGNLIASTGTTANNYLFAGEQFDPALGIYYNRARYFDQRQGRFWSRDGVEGDIEDPLSLHLYLYSHANSVNLLDPSGKTPLGDFVRFLATKGISITSQLFGLYAHQFIQADIRKLEPDAVTEFPIPGGRIDLFIPPDQIFEIKPLGGTVDPERQIDRYIISAGEALGLPLKRGTIFFDRIIDGPLGISQIHYFTSTPGVITYTAFPSTKLLTLAIATVIAFNTAQLYLQLGVAVQVQALAPGVA